MSTNAAFDQLHKFGCEEEIYDLTTWIAVWELAFEAAFSA